MQINDIQQLVYTERDGTLHHFFIGGETIIPDKFSAVPYRAKNGRREFDEIPPNGIFTIIGLEWFNEMTQWVRFVGKDGIEYYRDSKMCRTWSIPAPRRNGGLWTWVAPFEFFLDGQIYHETSRTSVENILRMTGVNKISICNGFNSSYLWEKK